MDQMMEEAAQHHAAASIALRQENCPIASIRSRVRRLGGLDGEMFALRIHSNPWLPLFRIFKARSCNGVHDRWLSFTASPSHPVAVTPSQCHVQRQRHHLSPLQRCCRLKKQRMTSRQSTELNDCTALAASRTKSPCQRAGTQRKGTMGKWEKGDDKQDGRPFIHRALAASSSSSSSSLQIRCYSSTLLTNRAYFLPPAPPPIHTIKRFWFRLLGF